MPSRLENILVELDVFAKKVIQLDAWKGKHMSESLFDKYGGVETLTPLVKEFYKRIMATPNLARYFINTDMEVLIRHQVQFIAVVMGKPAAFYEGMYMEEAHNSSNISERSFEDVIDVLEDTLKDFQVEEDDIIEILDKAKSLKKEIVS